MTENSGQGLVTCPNCGARVIAFAGLCPACGRYIDATPGPSWSLADVPSEPAVPTPEAPPQIPSPDYTQSQGFGATPTYGQPPTYGAPPTYGQAPTYGQPQGYGWPPAPLAPLAGYGYGYPPARARGNTPVAIALGIFGLVLILVAGLLVVFAAGSSGGSAPGATPTAVATQTAGSRTTRAGATPTIAAGPSSASGVTAPTVLTPTDIPSSGRTLGSSSAPVTVVVWEDYQCPPCGTWAANVMPQVTSSYVRPGKVKVVVHYLLVIDANIGGTESADAANAAMCAADQDKFWVYQDWLFANQGGEGSGAFSKVRLMEIGRGAGLDLAKLQPCVGNDKHLAEVQAESDSTDAQALPGVPAVSVNGRLLPASDFETISAAIDGVST